MFTLSFELCDVILSLTAAYNDILIKMHIFHQLNKDEALFINRNKDVCAVVSKTHVQNPFRVCEFVQISFQSIYTLLYTLYEIFIKCTSMKQNKLTRILCFCAV